MPVHAPPCIPAQIRVVADAAGGDFDGMSHGGSWLILRNTGTRTCRLPALPLVRLLDARSHPLVAKRRAVAAAAPVTITANGRMRLALRWVSGAVYDHSRCLMASRVAVTIGGGQRTAAMAAHLCGPAGSAVSFDQTALEPLAG